MDKGKYRWDGMLSNDGYEAIVMSEIGWLQKIKIELLTIKKVSMTSVKKFYLVPTKYGINLIAETYDGDYYQQEQRTLCHEGGGAFVWVKLEKDDNEQPKILNAV